MTPTERRTTHERVEFFYDRRNRYRGIVDRVAALQAPKPKPRTDWVKVAGWVAIIGGCLALWAGGLYAQGVWKP